MALKPEHTAFIFPGQGSQFVGMGRDLAEIHPIAAQVFDQADNLLDIALSRLAWVGPKELLDDTINTQPALLVHSVAALRVFQEIHPDFTPAFVAGHSMGELSALVASGALPFPETLLLTRKRGELMKRAGEVSPGRMAAIIGLDIPTLERICSDASTQTQAARVANDNCPGQIVISGSITAVDRAMKMAQEAGARRTISLAVSIAAHSPLMVDAQFDFKRAVESASIVDPHFPIIGNVTATPLFDSRQIRTDLQGQLTSRVRWTQTVQHMISRGITTFLELGSGSVLTGLLRRIDRQVKGIALGSPADFSNII